MRQKLIFIWHILIYNLIKPLPLSSNYFINHLQLPIQDLCEYDSHYKKIVQFGKEKLGQTGIFLANISLMFFCLPLCFLADLLVYGIHSLSIKIAVNAFLALIMLSKFDILNLRNRHNFLKLFYLFSCMFLSSYWTLTCVFLAAFENIVV